MRRTRRSSFASAVLLPFTLLVWLTGCYKWVPLEPPVAQAVSERTPGTIRITLADGSQVVLKEPRVMGDSLRAIGDGAEHQAAAFPLEGLREVEEKRANVPVIIGLAVGGIAVALGLAVVIACAVQDCVD